MKSNDIREAYIDFFQKRGHVLVPSALLTPENDPTTLFTGSGMQPILPYLLGEKHPLGARIVDSQKCFRTQDIEEVGDNRHTTFFEMLGNWSFGDYFKEEQITWMWEFLTERLKLDPKRLYFTCFRGNTALGIPKDIESAQHWQKLFAEKGITVLIGENPEKNGMRSGEQIFYYAEQKNWWSRAGVPNTMPVGEPGGPDTEIFWDFGATAGFHEQSAWSADPCHVNCDCGRFMEIGNNVFMEYRKTQDGFEKLTQKNVDFGGGLERLMAAVLDNPDIFMGDIFDTLRQKIETLSGKRYGADPKDTYAFRVLLDHMRASVFLIADGVRPSNTDQGYVLRRLLRRAVRFADTLGIAPHLLSLCVEAVTAQYTRAYPSLLLQQESIVFTIDTEEKKFRETLLRGMRELERRLAGGTITGRDAFELFSTYGFPFELIRELAGERNVAVDEAEFRQEMSRHQELSRSRAEQKFKGGLADTEKETVMLHTATHLMLAGLRKYLGDGVHQAGSNITAERTRFDFTYPEKVSRDVLDKVEAYVNEAIAKGCSVTIQQIPKEEAQKIGVEGSFWEKYPAVVNVYTILASDGTVYSRELCGGPHIANTEHIQRTFKIIKEEASSAGVRRIKALFE